MVYRVNQVGWTVQKIFLTTYFLYLFWRFGVSIVIPQLSFWNIIGNQKLLKNVFK